MPRVVRRVKDEPQVDLATLLTEFRQHKTMSDQLLERIKDVKGSLMRVLERQGVPDEKGSLWITFEEPVAGYTSIKRERRSSLKLDVDRAERILRDAGVYEQCVDVDITIDADKLDQVLAVLKDAGIYEQVVTVTERLNDDKILQTYFDEVQKDAPRLEESDIDAMFTETVSWAFVPR